MTIKNISTEILNGIKEGLEKGMLENDVAVKFCCIDTYYRWKREIFKVNDKGEVIDKDGNVLQKDDKGEWIGEPVKEFKEFVEKAIITYKEKIYGALTLNSIKSGQVALEVLRRRFPKEWNVPIKSDVTTQGQAIGGVIILPTNGRDKPRTD
jgi:hypothetical protein